MKRTCGVLISLLIVSGSVSCGLAAPKVLPTATLSTSTQLLSSEVTDQPTFTIMTTPPIKKPPTSTETYSSIEKTPTSVPTLEPDLAKATIASFSFSPMNCSAPCFWGIIPGETHLDEAKIMFHRLGFTPFEGYDPNTKSEFYTIEYNSANGSDIHVTLHSSKNLVNDIVINPYIEKQNGGISREWPAYSPETLINQYGQPSRVDFYLGWPGGGGSEVVVNMYFAESDLIVNYKGDNMVPSNNHSPLLCPLTDPFDYVRLWLGSDPPNPPLEGVPLEQATSLTLDQFAQLMLGNPEDACFTLEGKAFQ